MIATTQVLSLSTPELELAVFGLPPPAVDGRPVDGRPMLVPLVLVAVRGRDWAVRGRAEEGREEDMITRRNCNLMGQGGSKGEDGESDGRKEEGR